MQAPLVAPGQKQFLRSDIVLQNLEFMNLSSIA